MTSPTAGDSAAGHSHKHGVKSFMTTCERCNTENLEGSQYCDECGAPLNPGVRSSQPLGTGETGGSTPGRGLAQPVSAPTPSPARSPETRAPAPAYSAPASQVLVAEEVHATLVIERGRSAGKKFPLTEEESQIGRWDADGGIFPEIDLDADDPEAKVSRRHARIMRRNGEYFVEDLGSTNGTFINRGRRLLPGDRQALRDGDEIIVGKTFLRFHIKR